MELQSAAQQHPALKFSESGAAKPQIVFDPSGEIHVGWPNLFEFLISNDGTKISVTSKSRVSLETLRAYLLGQVLSFALVRQGIEPLHGTVIVTDHGAVLLMGDSTYGKSSLAAAFLKMGYQLLTDDLVVLQPKSGLFVVLPGVPRIKLFPDAAQRFVGGIGRAKRLHPNSDKLVIALGPKKICQLPTPLRAIFVLAEPSKSGKASRITIRRLSQRRAFAATVSNTFNSKITDRDRLRRQFEMATRVVSEVPVKALCYPRGFDFLPAVCNAILADVDQS